MSCDTAVTIEITEPSETINTVKKSKNEIFNWDFTHDLIESFNYDPTQYLKLVQPLSTMIKYVIEADFKVTDKGCKPIFVEFENIETLELFSIIVIGIIIDYHKNYQYDLYKIIKKMPKDSDRVFLSIGYELRNTNTQALIDCFHKHTYFNFSHTALIWMPFLAKKYLRYIIRFIVAPRALKDADSHFPFNWLFMMKDISIDDDHIVYYCLRLLKLGYFKKDIFMLYFQTIYLRLHNNYSREQKNWYFTIFSMCYEDTEYEIYDFINFFREIKRLSKINCSQLPTRLSTGSFLAYQAPNFRPYLELSQGRITIDKIDRRTLFKFVCLMLNN